MVDAGLWLCLPLGYVLIAYAIDRFDTAPQRAQPYLLDIKLTYHVACPEFLFHLRNMHENCDTTNTIVSRRQKNNNSCVNRQHHQLTFGTTIIRDDEPISSRVPTIHSSFTRHVEHLNAFGLGLELEEELETLPTCQGQAKKKKIQSTQRVAGQNCSKY